MRLTGLLLTVAGLALAAWLVASFDTRAVFGAVEAIGAGGFALFVAVQCAILGLLGAAQWAVLGRPLASLPQAAWARAAREGAGDVLPFTQVGGIVIGARVLGRSGGSPPATYAAMMADQTAELAAQALFTLLGVGGLAVLLAGGAAPWRLIAAGLGASVGIMAAFVLAQRPMLAAAEGLARRLLPGSEANVAAMREHLTQIYTRRGRLALSFALHLAAWAASAAASWLALRLMGVGVDVGPVLVIESLIFALRSAAFFVPSGLGVQEGAYALLGPLLGLDPALALALSLVKRARDYAVGVPMLLIWQAAEGRRLFRRKTVASGMTTVLDGPEPKGTIQP
ncbi:MAG: lysylphosphatidylglycerol synthase domain-containing protein [Sphingomonadaceae bacterium]|nr:lysylphosphatidylglycerol synthase domain-containing protein [Sphingomonadaceae bacterium]